MHTKPQPWSNLHLIRAAALNKLAVKLENLGDLQAAMRAHAEAKEHQRDATRLYPIFR